MVCSNCGSENPAAHRFCGMCGTPLPQRPITAPGAQSTLSFTRLPINAPRQPDSTVSGSTPDTSTAAVEENRPAQPPATKRRSQPAASVLTEPLPDSTRTPPPPDVPTVEGSSSSAAHADKNYFAEAEEAESLEQFVAGFHYTPPSEEEELTMTGDRPMLDSSVKYESAAPLALSDEPPAVAEPMSAQHAAAPEPPPPVAEPVFTTPPPMAMRRRPSTPGAAVPGRETAPSRQADAPDVTTRASFLDVSAPPKNQEPAGYSTSIGGPSFLDLSDPAPAIASEDLKEPAHRSHWHAWVVIAIVLIFAALGLLEWRAEKHQTNSGPIGIMKMQIERLQGKKGAVVAPLNSTDTAPDGSSLSTTPASKPNGTNPNIQVTPQPQPQNTPPAANPADKSASQNPGAASNTLQPAGPLQRESPRAATTCS